MSCVHGGLEDILIASIDGLKGFPEAIAQVFPKTEIQLCVVHQIRNSLKYVVSRDQKAFMVDLKLIYKATSKDLAEHHLLELGEKWGKKYPAVIKSWQANWEALSQYFKYPEELRRIIYTTNIVEGFHRQVRKYTKNKGAFTSEDDIFHVVQVESTDELNINNEMLCIERAIKKSFDISSKPLVSVTFIELPESIKHNCLIIYMHHLVTDAFSWKIFVEDLTTELHSESTIQKEVTSYQQWAARLYHLSLSSVIKEQVPFWHSIVNQVNQVPSIFENMDSELHVEQTLSFSKQLTNNLRLFSNLTKSTFDELLITILHMAYKNWTGRSMLTLCLLSHGRHLPYHDISLVRTIGPCALFYPVVLNDDNKLNGFTDNLSTVKRVLRSIPLGGLGYFLNAYASTDMEEQFRINNLTVLFNYMGDFGKRAEKNLLTRIDTLSNRGITIEINHHGLSVVGHELDGKLELVFGLKGQFISNMQLQDFVIQFEKTVNYLCKQAVNLSVSDVGIINPTLFIQLKSGNNDYPPLIFIPGQGGTPQSFLTIAKTLSLPMRVYGIQTFGLNDDEQPFTSIESMASYNNKLLKLYCPRGPYFLVAYSYGGTLAFEMTNQLKQAYSDNCRLILIDAPPLQSAQGLSPIVFVERMLHYLNRSLQMQMNVASVVSELSCSDASIPCVMNDKAITKFVIELLEKNSITNLSTSTLDKLLTLYHRQVFASYDFSGKSIDKMTILLADELINEGDISPGFREKINTWQSYVDSPISYINVPGNHFSLLNEPNVETVSKILQNVIFS